MPRSRQAYLRNAVVTHNPMQRMLLDPTSIAKQGPSVMAVPDITMVVEDMLAGWTNLIIEVPSLFEDVINAILGAIDTATGLDLTSVAALLDDITVWIDNAGAALQQGWLGLQQLINGIVGGVDKDVTDLIAVLTQTSTDVTTLQGFWQTLLDDLGLGAIPDLALFLADIQSWIDQVGASLTQGWLGFQQLIDGITGQTDANVADLITALTASGEAFTTLLSTVWTVIEAGGSYATEIAALETAWTTYTTTVSGLASDEIASLVQMASTVLGISPVELQTLQTEFTTLQTDFTAGNTAFSTLISSAWTAVETYTSWSGFLTAIEAAWSTYIITVSDLTSGEFATVQQILDTLLGIDPGTGKVKGNVDTVYPTQRGRGALSATARATRAVITAQLSGRGTILPRPGSSDVQMWQTFNTIIGVVIHAYPDLFGQGVLRASAVNKNFTFPVAVSGRGVLGSTVQEWQTFTSIIGVKLVAYTTQSGRGVLSATARSVQFKLPGVLSARGVVAGTIQDIQGESGTNVWYGLNPVLSSRGVLSGIVKTVKFPVGISGRGVLLPIIQQWQTFNSILGVIEHIYIQLPGHGALTATVPVKQFSLPGALRNRGVLSAKVPDVTTTSFLLGTVEHVYSFLPSSGVLTVTAKSIKALLPATLSSRGVLASRSGGPSVGQLEQNLMNALWLALTGGGTGTVSELQAAFSDLMQLLGWTSSTNLGTGSPTPPAISSVPILGTLVPATNSTVANDIFGGSTFWASLMTLLFPSSGGSVGSTVTPSAVTNVLGGSDFGDDLTTMATQLFGSATVNAITTVEQDIAHFISNAISGGSAPTSGMSSPVAFLDNLLGINGIPHTNVAIPPNPGTGVITADNTANGTPFLGIPTAIATVSWTHAISSTANYVIMRISFYAYLPSFATATCNGVTMTQLTSIAAGDNKTYSILFGLPNPTTGSVSMSANVYSPSGSSIQCVIAESDSYIGVGSVSDTNATRNGAINPTHTVHVNAGDYAVQMFTVESNTNSETLTAYSKTSKYNSGSANFTGGHMTMLAGDATGTGGSSTFSCTASSPASTVWNSLIVELSPLPSSFIGSGYTGANTSTSASGGSSGNNKFASNFFNINTYSADMTYSTTGNTLTVGHDGWYKVVIHVLEAAAITAHFVRPVLYQNGAVVRQGPVTTVNTTASNTYTFGFSWNLYCAKNDTLQPGYWLNTTVSTGFVGESTGQFTYWDVTLANRSLF